MGFRKISDPQANEWLDKHASTAREQLKEYFGTGLVSKTAKGPTEGGLVIFCAFNQKLPDRLIKYLKSMWDRNQDDLYDHLQI